MDKNPTEARPDGATVLRLLGDIAQMTAEDVAVVDEQIRARRAELKGLEFLRKLAATRLGLPPARTRKPADPKAKPQPAAPKPSEDDAVRLRRLKAARLLNVRSPLSSGAIMAECEIGPTKITEVLNHPWFERATNGYRLTATGRAEALGG